MKPVKTRLGIALMNSIQTLGITQNQMADKCGLSQPTINKVISSKGRADETTLKKITNALDPETNAALLISHLEDEIERAGHKSSDYDIKRNPKKYAKKIEHAMSYIGSRINYDSALAELILDIVVMLERSDPQPVEYVFKETGNMNVAETE
jgi:transcriptional regulator with XRE-family HTH domain